MTHRWENLEDRRGLQAKSRAHDTISGKRGRLMARGPYIGILRVGNSESDGVVDVT